MIKKMTKVDENIKSAQNLLIGIVERCHELEEENDNLNKQIEQFKKGVKAGTNIIERLEEENKKLKECNKSQSEVINNVFIPQKERLEEENKKLKEENKELRDTLNNISFSF